MKHPFFNYTRKKTTFLIFQDYFHIAVNFAKRIIQSYYAAVTYIDHLIGNLLEHLRNCKLAEDTVVVLTSDHGNVRNSKLLTCNFWNIFLKKICCKILFSGWSLGEHAEWAKYSNFEVALNVPLLISIPQPITKITQTKQLNGSQRNSGN